MLYRGQCRALYIALCCWNLPYTFRNLLRLKGINQLIPSIPEFFAATVMHEVFLAQHRKEQFTGKLCIEER